MNTLHVEFDIPISIVRQANLKESLLSEKIKEITALFLYEQEKISLGKACELANISQWDFFELNKIYNIKNSYSDNDLQDDLKRLEYV